MLPFTDMLAEMIMTAYLAAQLVLADNEVELATDGCEEIALRGSIRKCKASSDPIPLSLDCNL